MGNRVGLLGLPDGEECYTVLRRAYTTLGLSAEEIHEIGLQENARIRAEMVALGERVLGTSDIVEIQLRLRTDPAMQLPRARR
jgi:uncharacterized protein (DUF885 family)